VLSCSAVSGTLKEQTMSTRSTNKLDYLKQMYMGTSTTTTTTTTDGDYDDQKKTKTKKKKKKKMTTTTTKEGISVFDYDENPFDNGNDDDDEDDFEKPVIVDDAHYRARAIAEDEKLNSKEQKKSSNGSGWVTVVEGSVCDDFEKNVETTEAAAAAAVVTMNKLNAEKKKKKEKKREKKKHDSDDDNNDDLDDNDNEDNNNEKTIAKAVVAEKKKSSKRQRHDSDDDAEDEKEVDVDVETKKETKEDNDDDDDDVNAVLYDSDGDVIPAAARKKETKQSNIEEEEQVEEETKVVEYDSDGDIIVKPQQKIKTTKIRNNKNNKNKTGLVQASEIVKEAEMRRKEQEERINNMSAEMSGKNAKTLVRDKATGKLLTKEEIEERAKGSLEPKKEREKPVWGAGLKQERLEREKEEELKKAAEAPFSRSEVDTKWNAEKMNEVRYGDPMAKKAYEKQQKEIEKEQNTLNVMKGVDKKLAKKHGFKVPQEVPKHSWRHKSIYVERNRYNIQPGRHWDGVDRSNGFEKKWLLASDKRKQLEIEKRGMRNLTDTVYDEDDFNED
jgi:pre-mRNA-splicing factor CWC26